MLHAIRPLPVTASRFQLSGLEARTLMVPKSSISSSVKPLMLPSTMASRLVPGNLPTTSHSCRTSSVDAKRLGTGLPSPSQWVGGSRRREPHPPRPERVLEEATHGLDLLFHGLTLNGVSTHHISTQCTVADEKACVHAQAPVQGLEKVAKLCQSQLAPTSSAASGIP